MQEHTHKEASEEQPTAQRCFQASTRQPMRDTDEAQQQQERDVNMHIYAKKASEFE
jgi:hypothetical protein